MNLVFVNGEDLQRRLLKREAASAEKRRMEVKHEDHPSKLYDCPYLGERAVCAIGKGSWCSSCKNYGLGKRYNSIKGGKKNFRDHRFDKRGEKFDRFLDRTGAVPWLYKDKRPKMPISL